MSHRDRPSEADRLAAGPPATVWPVLVAAALADGISTLRGVKLDKTACSILQALGILGVRTRVDGSLRKVEIVGCAGHWPEGETDLECSTDAVLGVLASACCTGWGRYRLVDAPDGALEPDPGMIAALRDLGADLSHAESAGRLPLNIRATGLVGTTVKITSPRAGQWLGPLLEACACSSSEVFIELATEAIDFDAVRAVLTLMEGFGVSAIGPERHRIIIPAPQVYRAASIDFSAS